MKLNWSKKTLGELCAQGGGRIQTGPFGSQLHQSDYSEQGVPVVMPTDIQDGKIDTSRIARVSGRHAQRLTRHELRSGDIVYGRRGDIGRQALITPNQQGWLCGTGCLRVRLGSSEVTPEFLHRYLSVPSVIGWIQNQAIGATMPNLNTAILGRVPIYYPDINSQKKIAAILTAYDDLIENNRQRITLLEKMAEEIYREWFVRLRFPGHEHTPVHKGVPEGWEVHRMRDLVTYYIGGGWGEETQTTEFSDPAFVIRGTDLPGIAAGDIAGVPHRYHKPSNLKSRELSPGDIIFEVSGGSKDQLLGRTALISKELLERFNGKVMCASFCKLIRPETELVQPAVLGQFFKLYYSTGLVGTFQVQSTGISNYQFEAFLSAQTLLVPTEELQSKYSEFAETCAKQIEVLATQIGKLSETRDLLLNRLISGRLRVDDLNIQFPPSMQDAA